MDSKARAYAIERRYRMLIAPWKEMLTEIRSERGALLGTNQYDEMAGVEKAETLDLVDSRLRTAEKWLEYYENERTEGVGMNVKRWLKKTALLSDSELEGIL